MTRQPHRQRPRSPAVLYAPLRAERAALRPASDTMRLVRTGMGQTRAARARLPGAAGLVAGVGAGLHPDVRTGELVVASEVRGEHGEPVAVPSAPLLAGQLRRLGMTVHVGPVLSTSAITRVERADPTDAFAVDMESAALAPDSPDQPFAVVRAVVDTPDHPLYRPGTVSRGWAALRTLRASVPALRDWAAATGPREVHLAAPRSFCAGVERAIDTVNAALSRFGPPVYVRRQIVHNAHVVRELAARGAVFVQEADEVPSGSVLVLAAHGVSPAVRAQARQRQLRVIDATCPLVAKVHSEVRRYTGRGDTVLLIGHAEHEEVEGTLGEAPDNVIVVPDLDAARRVRPADPDRVAYTMQTTLAVEEADDIARVLRERFPALSAPRTDDICYATTNRQRAVRAIAARTDLVLVVGSTNSSNSMRLVEVARQAGTSAHLVDDVGEVDLGWLAGARRVGVTAGASAPPHLVSQLVHCLGGLGPVQIRETRVRDEDVQFSLPREVS